MLRSVFGSDYTDYGKPILQEIKQGSLKEPIEFTVGGTELLWGRALLRHINDNNVHSVCVDGRKWIPKR